MNAATLSRRYGREPVSAYIGEGWKLMPYETGGVAFHRVGRSAITVGAPLGPEEDAAEATSAFRQHCRRKGWRPVIFQAAAPADGLESHLIAREAFIDVGDFSLSGSALANVRHSVSRARRDGMAVSWRRWSECDAETRAEMELISASWRGRRPELTFTYGRQRDIPNHAWVGLAVAPGGRIEAMSTWRPLPAGPGLVLDLIRRRKDSTPGAVELVVVEAVELARAQRLDWLSLGSVIQGDDLPRWLRLVMASAEACGGSGLTSFKEKFRPRWEDRYLALPAHTAGIAGVLALGIAHVRGARVRPEPAEKTRLRRPAFRWAAATGMTMSLCAVGIGAAAHDISWPAGGPPQFSFSSAAERIVPTHAVAAPTVNSDVSLAPLAPQLPARVQPAPAPSHVENTGETAESSQVNTPEPNRSVASLNSAALCPPTVASHPAVGAAAPVAPRPKTSPATTSNPGSSCATAVKQSPATSSSTQSSTAPATTTKASPATTTKTPPATKTKTPPASKTKPHTASHVNHPGSN